MRRHFPLCRKFVIPSCCLIAAGFLLAFHSGPSANAAEVVIGLAPSTFGQITPTQVITPASNIPYLSIQGDTRVDPSPSRIVIEFPLAGIASSGEVANAKFSAVTFGGGISGAAALKYSLFGYAGTGLVDLDTGASGQLLSGIFSYNFVGAPNPNLSNIDVTLFIKFLIDSGASHAGFVFRDVNTPDNTRTIYHNIVVQDTPNWGGDIPPSLSLTLVPEPSTPLLTIAAAALLLRRRRG